MANLHDDSSRGTLTADRLSQYINRSTRNSIESLGGSKNVTPLAAACWGGHLDVVRLLLDNPYALADPNTPLPHNRTALFYATTKAPPFNRAAIVQALLKAGADPNESYSDDDGNTPLINAIVEVRDKDVVRELLNRGASVTKGNARGQTAESLAKGTTLESVLAGDDKLNSTRADFVDGIVSVVMTIITYANGGASVREVVQDTADKMYKKLGKEPPNKYVGVKESRENSQEPSPAPRTTQEPLTSQIAISVDVDDDSQAVQGAGEGILASMYGITGNKESVPIPEIAQELLAEPKTPKEFVASLDTFVKESGLEKFFAPGARFLQTLAEKAVALRDDPTTSLGSPENIKRLTRLSLYQPVIYCDDSSSMRRGDRFKNQQELVERIARIATKLVPDDYGVELCFINAGSASNLNAAQIEAAMMRASPARGTNLGKGLRKKILQPLVYDVLDNQRRFERPVLVTVITDGHPDPEPVSTFHDAIVECKQRLVNAEYESTAVMFSISQIGDDPMAKKFLNELKDEREIEDILYCTAESLDEEFKELRANERRLEEWLLRVLTAPIMERAET